jgi:elongator complex protein 1
MASYIITLPSTPIHVGVSDTDDALSVGFADGTVQVWDLNTRLPGPKGSKLRGGGKVAEPQLCWEGRIEATGRLVVKQVAMGQGHEVAVLCWGRDVDGQALGRVMVMDDGQVMRAETVEVNVERVLWSEAEGWLILNSEGHLRSCKFSLSNIGGR